MEQMNIFDWFNDTPMIEVDKPIRLIEMFAGVGSQAMALRDIGANFTHHKVIEFDKYAIASYNAIHGTDFPAIDITTVHGKDLEIVDRHKYFYICTYSFPYTDISVAGKMQGYAEGSGTRSSLLWEVRRILDECDELPQMLLMENVIQVHSKSNMPHFQKWLSYLEDKGYNNFYQDINAKNMGIPQSRNRTFVVSLLGNQSYKFPEPIPLTTRMKDFLEDEVDEKYYIQTDRARKLIDELILNGKILTDGRTDGRAEADYPLRNEF